MKTIDLSAPGDLFFAADALARRLGVGRSELYATTMAEFLARREDADVRARLDALYTEESNALDAAFRRAQSRTLTSERCWPESPG
jgi:hypothetical protein